jgi:hypothetical protein
MKPRGWDGGLTLWSFLSGFRSRAYGTFLLPLLPATGLCCAYALLSEGNVRDQLAGPDFRKIYREDGWMGGYSWALLGASVTF